MRRVVAQLAGLAAALAMSACAGGDGITIADLNRSPESYVGEVVTVRGDIESVHGPGLFTLDGSAAMDDEILVYTPEHGAVEEGAEVSVSGPVRMFAVTEVERELGLDLDYEIEIEFDSRPVMMSADVTVRPQEGGA